MSVHAMSKDLNIPKSYTKEIFFCQSLGADDYNSIIKRGTATHLKTFILKMCNAPAAHLQRGNW